MQKFALHYREILKGDFELKPLNFLFVFQVNCPGCFLYGIPLMNQLYSQFKNDISFLGLSTAFEDFSNNTIENTELFIDENEIIGHVKKAFLKEGYKNYPFPVQFPIAMDKIMESEDDIKLAVQHICNINPNYNSFTKEDQFLFKNQAYNHLKGLDRISMTFTLNQLKGTPSMLLFDDNYNMIYHKFGHIHSSEIEKQLHHALEQIK